MNPPGELNRWPGKAKYSKGMKEAVSRNSAIIGNYKMPVKLRET